MEVSYKIKSHFYSRHRYAMIKFKLQKNLGNKKVVI